MRGQARAIYEQIVRQQRDPALVEWMGYGMLRARIFPIAPGEEKKVVVRFQMVAEREGDALRIDYFQGKQVRKRHGAILADFGETDLPRGSFTLTYPADSAIRERVFAYAFAQHNRHGEWREVHVIGMPSEITLLIPVRRAVNLSISSACIRASW